MNSIISKHDINHFLLWSEINESGAAPQEGAILLGASSTAKNQFMLPNSLQLSDGETVRITQHTEFQLARRSITPEEVRLTLDSPDEILTFTLDNKRKIYQKYLSYNTIINIMIDNKNNGVRLVVGAWVCPK